MSFKYGLLTLILTSCFTTNGIAQSTPTKEQLIISNCMFEQLKDRSNLIAQSEQFSLIELTLNNDALRVLHKNRKVCGKFLNLDSYNSKKTHTGSDAKKLLLELTQKKNQAKVNSFPISHEKQVAQLYQLLDPNMIWQTSQHLTSYINRSATKKTGVDAAHWFKDHFDDMAQEYNRKDVESYFVETGKKYIQPSVVTVIGKEKTDDAIVIGAHIDTLSGNMPGADDDASGIAVAVEIARVLLSSELRLNHPVYIIAYSAEERGLVGSGFVIRHIVAKHIPIKAVMQLDQAGFRANPKDNTIWLLKDYVDTSLTQFLAQLLTHYVKVPVDYTECGYACSDHANWTAQGFSACYPSATTLDNDNPYVHSSEDTLEIINLEHMVNFTKLGLAFVTELGM